MSNPQKKAAQKLVGIGLGVALFHVCPPVAIVLGLGSWLGACRRMANAKDDEAFHDAALDVFTGYPAGDLKAFADRNGGGTYVSRQPVIVTVTDGMDTRKDADDFVQAVRALRDGGIFHLSVGIGSTDVDHRGLAYLAHLTGGEHIVAITSEAIAQAMADTTTFILTAVQRHEQVVQTEDALHGHVAVAVQQAAVRVKVDALLLIDNSGSMFGVSDTGTGDPQKMPRTKAAISRLVDSLRPPDDDGTEYDRVAVSKFSDDYHRITGFTSNFAHAVQAVNGIGQGGGTALYRAIAAATREFS